MIADGLPSLAAKASPPVLPYTDHDTHICGLVMNVPKRSCTSNRISVENNIPEKVVGAGKGADIFVLGSLSVLPVSLFRILHDNRIVEPAQVMRNIHLLVEKGRRERQPRCSKRGRQDGASDRS